MFTLGKVSFIHSSPYKDLLFKLWETYLLFICVYNSKVEIRSLKPVCAVSKAAGRANKMVSNSRLEASPKSNYDQPVVRTRLRNR